MFVRYIFIILILVTNTLWDHAAENPPATFGRLEECPDVGWKQGVVDHEGNRIIAFGKPPFWDNNPSPSDFVVVKSNAKGETLWSNEAFYLIRHIAIDSLGNIYVVGEAPESPEYFSTFGVTPEGRGGYCATKISPAGVTEWVRLFGPRVDPNTRPYPFITADQVGNYYVAGEYRGTTAKFGDFALPSAGEDQATLFFVKFSQDGKVEWAKAAPGAHRFARIHDVEADAFGNTAVVAGSYESGYSFEPEVIAERGIFLAKFDPSGKQLWRKDLGRGLRYDCAIDKANNIFVGYAPNKAFDGATAPPAILRKYSPGGDILWTRLPGAMGPLRLGSDGSCIISGVFGAYTENGKVLPGRIFFGGIELSTMAIQEMFVVKYASSGDVQWAINSVGLEPMWVGDPPPSYSSTVPDFLASNSAGAILVGGRTSGAVQFGESIFYGPGIGASVSFVITIEEAETNGNSERPALGITQAGNSIRLHWPSEFVGFLVQASLTLENPEWTVVNSQITLEGTQYVLTLTPEGAHRFFRLKKP